MSAFNTNIILIGVLVIDIESQFKDMIETKAIVISARPIVDMMIDKQTFGRIDARVQPRRRVQIDTVEIDAHLIGAIVAACHSVRIEHGYEFEDELTAQETRARILLAQHELHEAVEDVRRRRLAWVHTAREHEDALLVESKAAFRVRVRKEMVRIEARLSPERYVMIRGYCDQVDAAFVE